MKKISSIFLISIFSILSIIHFYWGIGGEWGFKEALPLDENGIAVLNPASIDSFLVGFILIVFAFFYLKLLNKQKIIVKFFKFFIPSIFLLRAIGDFRFVGFFKSITNSNFAKLDTTFYTPICLLIGFTGFYLAFKKQ